MIPLLVLLSMPAALADGASDYATYCATCHGASGAGDGAVAASLDPKPADFTTAEFWTGRSDEDVKKAIADGGAAIGKSPRMAAYGAMLSAEQIDAMVVYLKTMKKD